MPASRPPHPEHPARALPRDAVLGRGALRPYTMEGVLFVRYLFRLGAAVALLLLLAAPALAQGQLTITDLGQRLDEDAVREAAQPLVDRGALVAVYLVQSGGAEDFTDRLIEDDLARDSNTARSTMVAIYVALDQRYSEIRYGDEWSDALAVNENAELIRSDQLNPGLSDQDYTRGFTSALTAIDDAIANPPVPGGGTVINVDPGEAFSDFVLPVAGVAGVGVAAAVGGVALARRRRAAQVYATAQQRLKDAREGAGTLIAELGRRFNDATEKAKYDRVSYSPADVAQLAQLQQGVAQQFVAAQTSFDDIGENLDRYEKPTNEQLAQAAAGYDTVRANAEAVAQGLTQVEQRRQELDQLGQQAPGELDRAKKA